MMMMMMDVWMDDYVLHRIKLMFVMAMVFTVEVMKMIVTSAAVFLWRYFLISMDFFSFRVLKLTFMIENVPFLHFKYNNLFF